MFRKIAPETGAASPTTITVDGVAVTVEDGEPLAAALLRIPPHTSRTTPVTGAARAPFCMMGACFDCLVEIDGQASTRSCLFRVRPGMTIVRLNGRPDVSGAAHHD